MAASRRGSRQSFHILIMVITGRKVTYDLTIPGKDVEIAVFQMAILLF